MFPQPHFDTVLPYEGKLQIRSIDAMKFRLLKFMKVMFSHFSFLVFVFRFLFRFACLPSFLPSLLPWFPPSLDPYY
jgi:hypothetical protein